MDGQVGLVGLHGLEHAIQHKHAHILAHAHRQLHHAVVPHAQDCLLEHQQSQHIKTAALALGDAHLTAHARPALLAQLEPTK